MARKHDVPPENALHSQLKWVAKLITIATCAGCVTPTPHQIGHSKGHSNLGPPLNLLQKNIEKSEKPAPEHRFNFRVTNLPAIFLLEAIHRETGLGFDSDDCAESPVNVTGLDLHIEHLLDIIASQTGADYALVNYSN